LLNAKPSTIRNFKVDDDKKMKENFYKVLQSGNHRNYERMKKLQVDD